MSLKNLSKHTVLTAGTILDQVLNGVASRMAILYLLCGGKVNHGDD